MASGAKASNDGEHILGASGRSTDQPGWGRDPPARVRALLRARQRTRSRSRGLARGWTRA